MQAESTTQYEIADSHPAARTTLISQQISSDPEKAAAGTLDRELELEPLSTSLYDRFVLAGGWRGWRVSKPESLIGKWVYTRPVNVESPDIWPPRVWKDCVARYEMYKPGVLDEASGSGMSNGRYVPAGKNIDIDWRYRLARDQVIVEEMIEAMGTTHPLDPFCSVSQTIGRGVLRTTIEDMGDTYRFESPGTRIEPRALCVLLTQIGVRRATEYLVSSHFIDRAELWLYEQAEAGVSRKELDRIELRLLKLMNDRGFIWVARCCAIATMCGLDPTAAELWYQTGGDCSGHPNIRTYAAQVRERLLVSSR